MKRRLMMTAPTRSVVVRALCLWVLLLAASASAQDITTDYDHSVDFSRYRTFAWVEGKGQAEGFADKRIKQAVEQQLKAKGLRPAATGAMPDLHIVYRGGVSQHTSAAESDVIYNPERFDDHTATGRVSLEGKLVVDLVDAARKELVWRGTAVAEVSEDTSKNREKIEKAVAKMFKKFPPPPKAR